MSSTKEVRKAKEKNPLTEGQTMKVLAYKTYGGPEVYGVEHRPVPVLSEGKPDEKGGEVLIRVHYSTVTATEAVFRRGDMMARLFTGLFRPKMQVLGEELAGTVVGSRSERFKEGDRVFGITGPEFGAHAQYIVLPDTAVLLPLPDSIAFEDAVACLDGFLTSLPFLRDVGCLKAGQKILINGASGSVGSAAVQVARMFGAEVTAVCSEANHALVKSIGADHVLDYRTADFTKSDRQYDVIFDTVGNLCFGKCKNVLTENGLLLEAAIGFSVFPAVLFTSLFSKKKVKIAATGLRPAPEKLEDLKLILSKMQSGDFKAVIDRIVDAHDIVEAHRYVDTGRKRGNLLVRMAP
jgi:NADPH:quinone reductase-like Zn-dependent oxidoreductase